MAVVASSGVVRHLGLPGKAHSEPPGVGPRRLRPWAVITTRVLAVTAALLTAAAVALALALRDDPGNAHTHVAVVPALLLVVGTGVLVAWSKPRNAIGWLLLAVATLQAISIGAGAYAAVYASPIGAGWPAADLVGWVADWTWLPSVYLPLAVLPVVYPLGHPTSWRWTAVAVAGTAGSVLVALRLALGEADAPARAGLWHAPDWLVTALGTSGSVLLGGTIALIVPAIALRTLRARSPERQQLLLLLAAVAVALLGLVSRPAEPIAAVALSLPAVAVCLGILRYHVAGLTSPLRGILYVTVLTGLVVAITAGVTAVAETLGLDQPIPLLVSATAVALLIGPLSSWLRRQVDRLLLGAPVDPIIDLERHPRIERGDRHDPLQSVVVGLVEAIGVRYAAVIDEAGRTLASTGELDDPDDRSTAVERVRLRSGRNDLGVLVMSSLKDLGGRRIVAALTVHIAAVLRAQQLAADVQAERTRAVAAEMSERERVRQDLHDGLGPSLSGISLSLQAAETALARDPEAARALVRRARDETDLAGAEVRRVLDRLGPAALDHADLADALRDAAHRLGFDGDGTPVLHLDTRLNRTLPPRVEETAYRIAHEALTNVIRHAGATTCTLTVRDHGDHLELCISDDGRGVPEVAGDGVGLSSMRMRAAHAGGTVDIRAAAAPDHGTRVNVSLPLEATT